MPEENFVLHFRQDFSLLAIDTLLQGTDYLNVDHIFLFTPKPNSFSAYLSKEGLKQARVLGEDKILKNKDWKVMLDKTKESLDFIDSLKDSKIPTIGAKGFIDFWKQIKKHTKIILSVYFYCEEPTLASLEDKKKDKAIYNILSYIGEYKLEAHKKISVVEEIIHKLSLESAKFFNLDVQDIESLTSEEYEVFLLNGADQEVVSRAKKRRNGYVYHQKDGEWVIETGQGYEKWKKVLMPDDTEVKGAPTYKTKKKVIGKVRIHLSFTKITKLSKDEILVTGMTNPQMIPYIKNIKGIVTEEGGLMCHAAIISRELKIPCIVGTKTATQVFKDGDLIELDTESGIVRKL